MVKALDKKKTLSFVGFSHPLAHALLGELTDSEFADGMHLVEIDGTILTGSDSSVALLRHLPGIRMIGNLANSNAPVRRAVEGLYSVTASHRAKLARFVPDVPPIERLPNENDTR